MEVKISWKTISWWVSIAFHSTVKSGCMCESYDTLVIDTHRAGASQSGKCVSHEQVRFSSHREAWQRPNPANVPTASGSSAQATGNGVPKLKVVPRSKVLGEPCLTLTAPLVKLLIASVAQGTRSLCHAGSVTMINWICRVYCMSLNRVWLTLSSTWTRCVVWCWLNDCSETGSLYHEIAVYQLTIN